MVHIVNKRENLGGNFYSRLKNFKLSYIFAILGALFLVFSQASNVEATSASVVKTTLQNSFPIPAGACTLTISLTQGGIDGNTTNIPPGSKICVTAGNRTGNLTFKNLHGTASQPIYIVNSGGQVNMTSNPGGSHAFGIFFSSFIRATGTGTDGIKYGFKIYGWGKGVDLGNLGPVTDIEVDHFELSGQTVAGIMAKTEPGTFGVTPSWDMKNTWVHDNYIHNTGAEGMYLGYTNFKSGNAHLMNGVLVYNNLVTDTGYDGIQVGSAKGDCRIFDNVILRDDISESLDQYGNLNREHYGMSGIQINPGYNCDAYNNFVKDGNGEGIRLFAQEGKIYNNIIVNQKGGGGIWSKNTDSLPETCVGKIVHIFNNTVVNCDGVGIGLANGAATGRVQNNIVVSTAANYIGKIYNMADKSANYTISNNLKTTNINDVKFVNSGADDYDLQSSSPAVNAGIDTSSIFSFDFYSQQRNTPFDEGAIEYAGQISADTIAPTVSVNHSPVSPLTSQTITISANASDASGIKEIKLYIDASLVKTCTLLTTCSHPTSYSTAGTHTYYATATDNSANQNSATSASASFSVTAPSPDPTPAPTGCLYLIPASQSIIDGATQNIPAGSKICIDASVERGSLTLKNINGTASNPITVVNQGGQVRMITASRTAQGLAIFSSSFVHVTGTGSTDNYGFYVSGWEKGVDIGSASPSTNIEVDHVEVANQGFAGFMAKTDPSCTNNVTATTFSMKNTVLHDNYVHDTNGEGFYVGSSKYDGHSLTGCGTKYPHPMDGINIYNNRVINTGLDGIQVGSTEGNCRVHDNIVLSASRRSDPNLTGQEQGILVNAGKNCDVYNNFIRDTGVAGSGGGIGIVTQADAGNIYNNIIINSPDWGIWSKTDRTVTGVLNILNNNIINTGSDGIMIYNKYLRNSRIQNNIIVNPGPSSKLYNVPRAYISLLSGVSSSNFTISNNVSKVTIDEVKFTDPTNDGYYLNSDSPALNAGVNVASLGVTFDFLNNSRPQEGVYEIGAIENPAQSAPRPTPGDTVAPTISSIQVSDITSNSSAIRWNTNEPSISRIDYGRTQTLGLTISTSNLITNHALGLANLPRRATYYYQVVARDEAGNESKSSVASFSTARSRPKSTSGLTASAGSVILVWTPPVDEPYLAGYAILRSTTGFIESYDQTYEVARLTGVSPTTWRDINVTAGTTYYYSLFVFDDEGLYSDPQYVGFTVPSSSNPDPSPIPTPTPTPTPNPDPSPIPTPTPTPTPDPIGGGGGGGGGSVTTDPSLSGSTLTKKTESLDDSLRSTLATPGQIIAFYVDDHLDKEKALVKNIDKLLASRLRGLILLQVEAKGQGWYVNPIDNRKYYLGKPADAFLLMRKLGLGIKHSELSGYLARSFPARLAGRIMLDVESHGEAYYINPKDLKGYYLKRPADALEVMRKLGLGITNINLRKIEVGEIK